MSKKKQLMKNTIIIFAGRVCTQLISYLLLPLYTSYLVTKEYGIVDLITTYVVLLVPIITLELEMSVFRYLIDARKNRNSHGTKILPPLYIYKEDGEYSEEIKEYFHYGEKHD